MKAVLTDLKNSLYIAGCRALGLVDKVVTGAYCELKEKVDSWALDAHDVVEGSAILEKASRIHVDEV